MPLATVEPANAEPVDAPVADPSPARTDVLRHIKRGIYVLAAFAAVAMLAWARAFFIPLTFALLLTLCLNPLVRRLRRIGLPRSLGAALVLVAVIALTVAAISALQDDAQQLLKQLPASTRHFQQMLNDAASDRSGWWHRLNLVARSAGAVPAAGNTAGLLPDSSTHLGATLLQGTLGAVTFLGQVAAVLFLVYFLLVVKAPAAGAPRIISREALLELGSQVQRFIGVLAFTNLVLGLLTWLAFSLLGVSHAAVWGLAAGIVHLVPYVGPAAIAGASAVAAAVQFESLGTGLLVASVSLGLSAGVGIVLTTWLMGKSSGMNAAVMFVGLLFWGWIWGLPGLLLGAPLMMTIKVIADRLSDLAWLSRLLSSPHRDTR
jgi:predicted PurR-regulated permease PerM